MKIAPSVLDADFGNLQAEVDSLAKADRIHLDIMDGHYVPNLTMGPAILDKIKFDIPTEAHLMVTDPLRFFPMFAQLGVWGMTFHFESTGNATALQLIQDLHSRQIRAGISIDAPTGDEALSDEVLRAADQILVMSVKAGFGGQSFMPQSLEKVKSLRRRGFDKEIEVDGGINYENIASVREAGADIAVVGSFLTKIPPSQRHAMIQNLRAR